MTSMMYLSGGDLPSKMTHTIQTAKMAEAFSRELADFELVTSGDAHAFLKGFDSEFKAWYGLCHHINLVRLPIHGEDIYSFKEDYFQQPYFHRFCKVATAYACLKNPSFVFTRTISLVDYLLSVGIPTLWEWHEPVPSQWCRFFDHDEFLGMVTISPYLAQQYIKQGVPLEKILVTPSAVSLETLLPYQSKEMARQQLFLEESASIVVYSGQLHDYKGIPTILEAAQLMPTTEFILVGGWPEDVSRVNTICQQKGLKNVRVTGHISQSKLPTYLYAADVLLVPTSRTWELAEGTSPLKMFDYMAVKRPIVASALPSIMNVLRHRENSLLVEPDHPQRLSDAIGELLTDISFSRAISEQAYQDVQSYTYDHRARNILQFANQRLLAYRKKRPFHVKQAVRGVRFLLRNL